MYRSVAVEDVENSSCCCPIFRTAVSVFKSGKGGESGSEKKRSLKIFHSGSDGKKKKESSPSHDSSSSSSGSSSSSSPGEEEAALDDLFDGAENSAEEQEEAADNKSPINKSSPSDHHDEDVVDAPAPLPPADDVIVVSDHESDEDEEFLPPGGPEKNSLAAMEADNYEANPPQDNAQEAMVDDKAAPHDDQDEAPDGEAMMAEIMAGMDAGNVDELGVGMEDDMAEAENGGAVANEAMEDQQGAMEVDHDEYSSDKEMADVEENKMIDVEEMAPADVKDDVEMVEDNYNAGGAPMFEGQHRVTPPAEAEEEKDSGRGVDKESEDSSGDEIDAADFGGSPAGGVAEDAPAGDGVAEDAPASPAGDGVVADAPAGDGVAEAAPAGDGVAEQDVSGDGDQMEDVISDFGSAHSPQDAEEDAPGRRAHSPQVAGEQQGASGDQVDAPEDAPEDEGQDGRPEEPADAPADAPHADGVTSEDERWGASVPLSWDLDAPVPDGVAEPKHAPVPDGVAGNQEPAAEPKHEDKSEKPPKQRKLDQGAENVVEGSPVDADEDMGGRAQGEVVSGPVKRSRDGNVVGLNKQAASSSAPADKKAAGKSKPLSRAAASSGVSSSSSGSSSSPSGGSSSGPARAPGASAAALPDKNMIPRYPQTQDATVDWEDVEKMLKSKIVLEFNHFMRRTMDYDQQTRLTPEQALEHPLFQSVNYLREWTDVVRDARGDVLRRG